MVSGIAVVVVAAAVGDGDGVACEDLVQLRVPVAVEDIHTSGCTSVAVSTPLRCPCYHCRCGHPFLLRNPCQAWSDHSRLEEMEGVGDENEPAEDCRWEDKLPSVVDDVVVGDHAWVSGDVKFCVVAPLLHRLLWSRQGLCRPTLS